MADAHRTHWGEGQREKRVVYRDVSRKDHIDVATSEFLALVSHQLRTPLTAIRWALGRLQREDSHSRESRERIIAAARHAVKSMGETIDRMLSVARIESGTAALEMATVHLPSFFREVRDLYRSELSAKRIRMTVLCSPSLALRTDAKLLKEVIGNLVSNAIKYSPPRSSISLKALRVCRGVRIEIRDRGMGIPETEQPRIFQKFYRGESALRTSPEGTGLGLYLAALIMGMLKGKISFTSGESRGTTFSLLFTAGASLTPRSARTASSR